MDLLQNCSDCCQFTLSEFPAEITITGALNPDTDYIVWVTDKFNNTYSTDPLTTDSDGNLVLTSEAMADFPVGWFSRSAGSFTIEAFLTGQGYNAPVDFTFNAVDYPCILVNFEFNNAPKTVIE